MKNLQNAGKLSVFLIIPFFILACSMFSSNSPTSSYKAFAEAAKNKDATTMRKYLSDESLKDMESGAKLLNKTVDEILTTYSDGFYDFVTISNETISNDGKSGSIEVATKKGDLPQKVNFKKESGIWKLHYGKPKAAGETAQDSSETSSSNSTDSPTKSDTSTPTETGPVTISASELVAEAKSAGSSMDSKYGGRMITVTGAELWEIQYSMLHIGARGGSYSSGYILCNGSFSDYMPYASKISDLRKQYKSPGATIKGTFSRVVVDSGYTQVHLSPCVLSNLEK